MPKKKPRWFGTGLSTSLACLLSVGCAPFSQSRLNSRLAYQQNLESATQRADAGDVAQAIELLQKSIKASPNDLIVHEQLVDLYLRNGNNERALRQLQQAIDVATEPHHLHARMGRILLDQGQVMAASEQSRMAVEVQPNSVAAWELKGDLAKATGDLETSIAAYCRATQCDPRLESVNLKLVQTYLDSERPLRALSTIENHLAHSGSIEASQAALRKHGEVLIEVKNFKRAIEQLRLACQCPDARVESFVQLSRAQFQYGQTEAARQTLLTAQRDFPEQAIVPELLAQLESHLPASVAANQPDWK